MAIRRKHFRILVSPPDLADTVLPYSLFNEVRNSCVPDDMRRYLLCDSRAFCNDPEPLFECLVPKRFLLVFADKNVGRSFCNERIICPPCSEVRFRHDKGDMARFSCLAISIDNNCVLTKGDLIPCQGTQLFDPECSFVQHGDIAAINRPGARFNHLVDLLFGQHLGSSFCHRIAAGCFDLPDLVLRDVTDPFSDQPEVKFLERRDVDPDSTCGVRVAFGTRVLETVDTCIEVIDGIGPVWAQEPSHLHQVKRELVDPAWTDIAGRLDPCNMIMDKDPVVFGNLPLLKCFLKRAGGILRLDVVKLNWFRGWCTRACTAEHIRFSCDAILKTSQGIFNRSRTDLTLR